MSVNEGQAYLRKLRIKHTQIAYEANFWSQCRFAQAFYGSIHISFQVGHKLLMR